MSQSYEFLHENISKDCTVSVVTFNPSPESTRTENHALLIDNETFL